MDNSGLKNNLGPVFPKAGRLGFLFFCLWFVVSSLNPAFANNIAVSNVLCINRETSNNTYDIKFDVSWDNSWFIAGAPSVTANWDAAWVFAKYSIYSGGAWLDWGHCTLLNTSYTAPSGSQMAFGITGSAYKGAFIYRSSAGTGSVNFANARMKWDYGADGVSDTATVKIKVFAIEMVYIPTGNFYVGDGTNRTGGSNSHFFDAADAADPRDPVLITSTQPYISNVSDGTGTAGDITWVNESGQAGALPTSRTQLNSSFPTGYNAFYIMKYEIASGQYADFLNLLASTQATTRFANRYGLKRDTLTGSYQNYSTSRPHRAYNSMSFVDVAAYADWAALRPHTELEYEKACRGPSTPVAGEYAWGSTVNTCATTISGSEDGTETITNSGANCSCGGDTNGAWIGGDRGRGPLRVGIFATSSSTREASGAGYYGALDLTGNVWEFPVHLMSSSTATSVSTFTGEHGDGSLSANGNANTANWPGLVAGEVSAATGSGLRGCIFNCSVGNSAMRVSNRVYAGSDASGRDGDRGGRCSRTAP